MCLKIHLLFFPALLKKFAYYSFLIPYYSYIILSCCKLLLETLPVQNEAYQHRHNYIHNNLSYLFIKVHQNHLKKHSQNLAINNCGYYKNQ